MYLSRKEGSQKGVGLIFMLSHISLIPLAFKIMLALGSPTTRMINVSY
jgi:hypothetical protein